MSLQVAWHPGPSTHTVGLCLNETCCHSASCLVRGTRRKVLSQAQWPATQASRLALDARECLCSSQRSMHTTCYV